MRKAGAAAASAWEDSWVQLNPFRILGRYKPLLLPPAHSKGFRHKLDGLERLPQQGRFGFAWHQREDPAGERKQFNQAKLGLPYGEKGGISPNSGGISAPRRLQEEDGVYNSSEVARFAFSGRRRRAFAGDGSANGPGSQAAVSRIRAVEGGASEAARRWSVQGYAMRVVI